MKYYDILHYPWQKHYSKNLNSSEVSHLQIIALLVDSISQQEKHKWDFYLIKRQQPKK